MYGGKRGFDLHFVYRKSLQRSYANDYDLHYLSVRPIVCVVRSRHFANQPQLTSKRASTHTQAHSYPLPFLEERRGERRREGNTVGSEDGHGSVGLQRLQNRQKLAVSRPDAAGSGRDERFFAVHQRLLPPAALQERLEPHFRRLLGVAGQEAAHRRLLQGAGLAHQQNCRQR